MSNEIISTNLIYLTIPKSWNKTYYKLLYLLSIEGKHILDDCNYLCGNKGNNVFTCWNMFQAALAAYTIKDTKRANLFIEYIDKQIQIYANRDEIIFPSFTDVEPSVAYEVQPDGNYKIIIKVIVNGKEIVKTIDTASSSGGGAAHVLYYGQSNTNSIANINIATLTKKELNTINNESIITHTDTTNKYIWVVSDVELTFTEAGFPVDFNHDTLGDLQYYWSDELSPGTNEHKVTQK